MLPGTQLTAPPPTTPGEVGAGPRTPGEVTLGLAGNPGPLIELLLAAPGLVVPGVVRDGFVAVGLVRPGLAVLPGEELPNEEPGIGCGVEPKVPVIGCGVEPKVPVIGSGVDVPPMLGLEIPGAELPPMVGEVPNVPVPVIGAGPMPGAVVPGVALTVGALPTAPEPPPAAVWAKATGAAATSATATATAEIMDFRLSIRVSFEIAGTKTRIPQAACPPQTFAQAAASCSDVIP